MFLPINGISMDWNLARIQVNDTGRWAERFVGHPYCKRSWFPSSGSYQGVVHAMGCGRRHIGREYFLVLELTGLAPLCEDTALKDAWHWGSCHDRFPRDTWWTPFAISPYSCMRGSALVNLFISLAACKTYMAGTETKNAQTRRSRLQ